MFLISTLCTGDNTAFLTDCSSLLLQNNHLDAMSPSHPQSLLTNEMNEKGYSKVSRGMLWQSVSAHTIFGQKSEVRISL